MAQEPDQLRQQIDQQRAEIAGTVDQIENRVNPSHVLARRSDRVKRRLTDWKDAIFGNDDADYPDSRYASSSGSSAGVGDQVTAAVSSASDSMQQAPQMLRRRTRGNPMAAGAIALGVGWLVGSLLPETRSEKQAVRKVEPQLSEAAEAMQQEGEQMADELKEPAQQALADVKDVGQEAADELKNKGQQAAQQVKDQAGS